jgi:hypothetical protein
LEAIMKALLATTLLLGLSSFTAARAEWEMLDPGTAVAPNFTAPVPAPAPATIVVTAPAPTVAAPTVATTARAGVATK